MKIFNLDLDHYNFFCPVTGKQVLGPEDMDSSKAMLFSYLEGNGKLDNTNSRIKKIFKECINEVKAGKYNDYGFMELDFECLSAFDKAFNILIYEKLKSYSNYVLYSITTGGSLHGDCLHMAFDMGYDLNNIDAEMRSNCFSLPTFYCPVTGEKLFEKGFKLNKFPPSLDLYYVQNMEDDNNLITLIHFSDSIKDSLIKEGFDLSATIFKAEMIHNFVKDLYRNYALHDVAKAENDDGLIHSFLIDMNYFEEVEEGPYENFPNINSYPLIFENCRKIEPQLEGYAVFIKKNAYDSNFYFFNSTLPPYVSYKEWDELRPAIIFSDFIDRQYSDIPSDKLESLNSLFYSYWSDWSTSNDDPKGLAEFKGFMEFTNEALENSQMLFLGPIEQLFKADTEFTKMLIDKFGKNPKDFTDEFLQFLKNYKTNG